MKQDFSFYSYQCSLIHSEVSPNESACSSWFSMVVFHLSMGLFQLKSWHLFCLFHLQKEDIESALRTSNMNLEDAIELLKNQGRLNMETWCRHEDHSPFDLPSSHPGAGFPGQRFNPVPQQMSFAPPVCYFMFKSIVYPVKLIILEACLRN
jgi:hypothetical protein